MFDLNLKIHIISDFQYFDCRSVDILYVVAETEEKCMSYEE